MKTKVRRSDPLTSELLLLPDGRILVHNLTQPFAELLRELNPDDEQISSRVGANVGQASRLPPSKKQRTQIRDRRDACPTLP
jgi:hypothetical protein